MTKVMLKELRAKHSSHQLICTLDCPAESAMASSSSSRPLGNLMRKETDSLPHPQYSEQLRWDVFLSHSGEQKPFVKGLNRMLSPLYNVFFDIDRVSLPVGEPFPSRIIDATRTCRLAVVVLSNAFFSSKWPMLELSEFVDAEVRIVPLFYKLSPADLTNKEKLQEWHKKWEELAFKDSRIDVSKWDKALRSLRSINGLVFKSSEGELAYLEEICEAIFGMAPPLFGSSLANEDVQGKERLCKVFTDKFEELEQMPQNSSANLSRVCLLGVYGLPGSGKSTLCACLRDYFSSSFNGRSRHFPFSSDPSPADQLLGFAKELLKLTDFGHYRERMMSEINDLSQIYSILQSSNLRSLRVFLVFDNISSQKSVQVVKEILRLGVGAGSRVMLVARTLEILSPLLSFPNSPSHVHYECGSMTVPRLNETEAMRLLMQSADEAGLASNHRQKMEGYSPSRRRIFAKVAHMCAFRMPSHQDLLHLPLALKIIGSSLSSDRVDLDIEFSKLEAKIMGLKKVAVREIVEESYKKLPEKLKLLFLDVALFMIPYCQSSRWIGGESAAELLGLMHECNPEEIKTELTDLMRLCFLESGFTAPFDVHDVFLEFAKSVPKASSEYYCRRRSMSELEVMSELCSITADSSAVGLRTLILELDKDCKKLDFPAGLRVKVVVLRHCKSLEVLGLTGLTSLLSLEIENCPRLRHLDFGPGQALTLKRVRWVKTNQDWRGEANDWQQEGNFQKSLPQMLQAGRGMQAVRLINKAWCFMSSALGGWHGRPPLNRQLKALQVLRLYHTGIRSLGDCSSCWPQLQVLDIHERHLEELEVGNLPNLKQFFYGTGRFGFEGWTLECQIPSRPQMLRKANLLAGCPELVDVNISDPSFEDGMGTLILPPKLRSLSLRNIYRGESVLPDFTLLAHLLERIKVRGHWVLRSIGFTCQLLSLERIDLDWCPNLVTITGLERLPNLQDLKIQNCAKLQSLGNLEGVRMLKHLLLYECAELQSIGNLEALRMLEKLVFGCCPVLTASSLGLSSQHLTFLNVYGCPNVQLLVSDLGNLTALSKLRCKVFGSVFNLKNLVNLEDLSIYDWKCEGQANNPVSLMGSCEQVDGNGAQVQSVPLFVVGEVALAHLSKLALNSVQNLVSLDGIHHCLGTLRSLTLEYLPKLTCLQGLQSLVNLKYLAIAHCPAVKELPSLCSLVKVRSLSITHCANLILLEGLQSLVNLEYLAIAHCPAVRELPSLCSLVKVCSLSITHCANLILLEGLHDMKSLRSGDFEGCENLEDLELGAFSEKIQFKGCKFANIQAMVGWVLDEKVSEAVLHASIEALTWELTVHLLEKPRERKALAERLVETLGMYLTKKHPALLTHPDDCFDFQGWIKDLKKAYKWACREREREGKGLEELMEKLGRVPLKEVLQQCQSDEHFRASAANCTLEAHPQVLAEWICELVYKNTGYFIYVQPLSLP